MAEATTRMEFLLTEHGFAGPEVAQYGDYPLLLRVRYHRGDTDVEVSLVLSYGGEEYVTAGLVLADEAAGSVRRTKVSSGTAHTGFQMRRALDRNAQALRELLRTRQLGAPG